MRRADRSNADRFTVYTRSRHSAEIARRHREEAERTRSEINWRFLAVSVAVVAAWAIVLGVMI